MKHIFRRTRTDAPEAARKEEVPEERKGRLK